MNLHVPYLYSLWLKFALVQYEIFLAGWLLTGLYRSAAWLVTLVTFFGFALVNLYFVWIGRASCGCLGDVVLHPGIMLAIDAVIVALLLVLRPSDVLSKVNLQTTAQLGLNYLVVLGLWSASVYMVFGSTASAYRSLVGTPIYAVPEMLDLGKLPVGSIITTFAEVQNDTDAVVHIVGGVANCTCTTLGSLPLDIPAGGRGKIEIQFKAPATQGAFEYKAILYTATSSQQTIPIMLIGRSVAP